MNRVKQLAAVQREARRLFAKKNADYGDAFATYGSVGVLVRMGDKIGRLVSVDSHKVHVVEDETLRDTLIDLHNYSAMAIMLLDEKGGGQAKGQEEGTLVPVDKEPLASAPKDNSEQREKDDYINENVNALAGTLIGSFIGGAIVAKVALTAFGY
jgi:hypothetical protein